ncbi:MAG: DUF2974 domain-containing protein [Clostridiales bacterium]|nr:DUF2974 domain-containing protein [Clostridiales bacterium]
MANIMDYLDWRGDLAFEHSPFNEVDNLILAQMSYVDFGGIVPSIGSNDSISIKAASEVFFAHHTDEEIMAAVSLTKKSAFLLRKMSQTERFSKLKLSRYVNNIDVEQEKQFSAITIELDDGTLYLAYRGTDETIVGWKEDFNMSFISPVPAQLEAVDYLNSLENFQPVPGNSGSNLNNEDNGAQKTGDSLCEADNKLHKTGECRRLRIGGHSKGGNLSVYAAMNCNAELKNRIIEVYNNDGPGFSKEITESDGYREVMDRIRTIVPQSSVVGMLLEHEEEYLVIKSDGVGLMQHDAMSWEVLGSRFVYVEGLSRQSRFLDASMKALIGKLDREQREQFVEALFNIFEESNVRTLADLSNEALKKAGEIIKVIGNMAPENKEILSKTIKMLFDEGGNVLKGLYHKRMEERKNLERQKKDNSMKSAARKDNVVYKPGSLLKGTEALRLKAGIVLPQKPSPKNKPK